VIVLVGFMGAGKTTVGNMLAERLGLPFDDVDVIIERREGRRIREIFAADGEPAFRELEHEVTAELLDGRDAVLALGGGAAEHPGTRGRLRGSPVVYLRVGYDEAMLRVSHDAGRPMLRAPDLQDIFERRRSAYESVATHIIPTDGRRPEVICRDIIEQLGDVCAPRAGQA
jgi:shikimate kinase/3-dehydroquinate synthase